jgi:hypothetical protein
LGNLPAHLPGGLVIRVVFFKPCGAEDGDTRANEMKSSESPDEFFEYFPGKTQFIGTTLGAV